MLIPCIDLMDGKAVQLVRGRTKALEADTMAMLRKFRGFPIIHVIDLDAAIGNGDNSRMIAKLCRKAACRVGGGVRTVERVRELAELGAEQFIIGWGAFNEDGVTNRCLPAARRAAGKKRLLVALDTSRGRVVVLGCRARTGLRAEEVMPEL